MLDELLVKATNKKLVLFCKIIADGRVRIEFRSNINLSDGKTETVCNCILHFLQNIGVNLHNVNGLGNNPCIVHIWCATHRVALVSHWATKRVFYMDTVTENDGSNI